MASLEPIATIVSQPGFTYLHNVRQTQLIDPFLKSFVTLNSDRYQQSQSTSGSHFLCFYLFSLLSSLLYQ